MELASLIAENVFITISLTVGNPAHNVEVVGTDNVMNGS